MPEGSILPSRLGTGSVGGRTPREAKPVVFTAPQVPRLRVPHPQTPKARQRREATAARDGRYRNTGTDTARDIEGTCLRSTRNGRFENGSRLPPQIEESQTFHVNPGDASPGLRVEMKGAPYDGASGEGPQEHRGPRTETARSAPMTSREGGILRGTPLGAVEEEKIPLSNDRGVHSRPAVRWLFHVKRAPGGAGTGTVFHVKHVTTGRRRGGTIRDKTEGARRGWRDPPRVRQFLKRCATVPRTADFRRDPLPTDLR